MNDDTRRLIYGTIVAFLVFISAWLGFIYISACGFTLTCIQGAPLVVRTPIPTLIPMEHSQAKPEAAVVEFNKCEVAATDLIGAWVSAGHAETEPFPFTDLNGQNCEGTFADIQPLFVENSIWFPGSLGCTSCHNADLTNRSAGLDLSSYEAVSLGTRRVAEATSPGTDIFGNGNWEDSLLHEVLVNQGLTTQGHSPDVEPPQTILYAGQVVFEAEVTETPAAEKPASTPEATATP
ncbi:MAG TPA: hypothetical protein VFQ13_12385 [Anaerolineales bacterium]|nr:hypothetical protein [Anaerolineales bacterium]